MQTAGSAVFIQCVGSRIPERPYCSKICCTHSLESALALKKMNPEMDVFILYRDLRSYGFREDLYREARKQGVIFIRYDLEDPPKLTAAEGQKLALVVTDHVLGRPVRIEPDLVVLASAILPSENKKLFELFKVPVNNEGFLIEAHAKLRPVDFASDGLFMAGLAHYPKAAGRDHRPGQGRRRAGGDHAVQAGHPGRRSGGDGRPRALRGLSHLRSDLSLRRPLHRGGRACRDRPGRMPGLRGLRGGMPGKGHPPAAFHRRADHGQGRRAFPGLLSLRNRELMDEIRALLVLAAKPRTRSEGVGRPSAARTVWISEFRIS